MALPLQILIVEDSPDDAELVAVELRRGGLPASYERVQSEAEMRAQLRRQEWDAILSDYVMPGFSGLAALQLVREMGLDIPFILVSGAIPDETAIAAMKAGSHDYVSKQNLTRLVPAVRRELGEAEIRRERRHAQEALRFLADAGVLFASSLDYDSTLEHAARLAVPRLADACIVYTLDARDPRDKDKGPRRAAAAHQDRAEEPLLRELADRFPPDATSPQPSAQVLFTGMPLLVSEFTDDVLRESARSEEHRRLLRAIGVRSLMIVPLVARGRTVGIMTLIASSSGRQFGAADLAVAEEFALRCALAIDNAALYRDAQEAIRLREEFLSVASHELRTPLTVLKLHVQMLLRPCGVASPGEHGARADHADRGDREEACPDDTGLRAHAAGTSLENIPLDRIAQRLVVMGRQVDRLGLLVDNLLDVSRLNAGTVELDLAPVDLVEIARSVLARFAPELSRAACDVTVRAEGSEGSAVGLWDRSRIDQIVVNLVSNAVKFGAQAPIEIEVEGGADAVVLRVRDHGIGIDPHDVARIFGQFERAVSISHYGGLGLGLHLTRQIVQAHGGTISVESRPGEGSTFTVVLPRHAQHDGVGPPASGRRTLRPTPLAGER